MTIFMFSMASNPFMTLFLSCHVGMTLDDLENSSQLPVQEVLGGTDDCVLQIFTISSIFMLLGSRNPLLAFLLSCHVWMTLKISAYFLFSRYFETLCPLICLADHKNHKISSSIFEVTQTWYSVIEMSEIHSLPSKA